MTRLKEVRNTVEVPASAGVEGFLHVVREVISQSRVQKVVLSVDGSVSYTRLVDPEEEEDEENNYNVDFSHLQPYQVIRNADMQEMSYPPAIGACAVVAAMFDAVTDKGYTPICFAVGADSTLWNWCHFTSGLEIKDTESLMGCPVYRDKGLPDTALVLCAGVSGTTALIDTKVAVKVEMQQNKVLNDEMEII